MRDEFRYDDRGIAPQVRRCVATSVAKRNPWAKNAPYGSRPGGAKESIEHILFIKLDLMRSQCGTKSTISPVML